MPLFTGEYLNLSQLQLPRRPCVAIAFPLHLDNHPNLRANGDQLTLLVPNFTAQIEPPITQTFHPKSREQPLHTSLGQILLHFDPHVDRRIKPRRCPFGMFRWRTLFCPLDRSVRRSLSRMWAIWEEVLGRRHTMVNDKPKHRRCPFLCWQGW